MAEVERLGGTMDHVESVPAIGRFAVIADPPGAVIAVFTPARAMASHDLRPLPVTPACAPTAAGTR